ncbi:hypothetical protein JCM24511_00348 [Saitozyma sp. JCM 24511]|nr:hypothetical protein JCM24511_00348 [Saitozyma sp. JCM 24511]
MSAPVLENNPISQGPSSGPAQDVDGPPTRPPGAPTKDDSGISGAAKTNLASDGDPDGKASSQADEEQRRDRAARTIQRNYRGYAARKWSKRMRMEKEARWEDLVRHTKEKNYAAEQLDNKNDIKSRWRRGIAAASRLQTGDGLGANAVSPEVQEAIDETPELDEKTRKARKATMWGSLSLGVGKERDEAEELPFHSKALEKQHWLEMIDGKHRYGSNLKYYFRRWKESDTQDNFFRWLDKGEGNKLDLEELPRERLDKERITYLTAEQRLNYLVKVDDEGKLRWVRNDELVDTAAGKWRDSGNGGGIVPDESSIFNPASDDDENEAGRSSRSRSGSVSSGSLSPASDSYSASSELQDNEATHYADFDARKEKGWVQRHVQGVTPSGVRKQILRKTVRRNTWIYVVDMQLNMFVGIKHTGVFQHSSFLAGGKVVSAGIIVVKHGVIKTLNPWSGHYRSTIQHYRSFIAQLENKGVDLSHVKMGKSVLTSPALWTAGSSWRYAATADYARLSKYSAISKGQKDLGKRFKRVVGISNEKTEQEKSEELEQNAAREEAEHMERTRQVWEAEEAEESEEGKERARKEVLYGRKREAAVERKEDTKAELEATGAFVRLHEGYVAPDKLRQPESPWVACRLDLRLPLTHAQLLDRLRLPHLVTRRFALQLLLDLIPVRTERLGQVVRVGDEEKFRAGVVEE